MTCLLISVNILLLLCVCFFLENFSGKRKRAIRDKLWASIKFCYEQKLNIISKYWVRVSRLYDVIHISPACICVWQPFLKQGIVFIKEIHREWVHTMSASGFEYRWSFALYLLNNIYQEFVFTALPSLQV